VKIFVTVGTGKFDELVRELDKVRDHQIVFQIGQGKYLPINHKFFRFGNSLHSYYQNTELVISHAGIGTIFEVLKHKKKLIVVPNLCRKDNHQMEIVKKLSGKRYFIVCTQIKHIPRQIFNAPAINLKQYKKETNTINLEITNFLTKKQ